MQLLSNFIARCDAKARAVFRSLQRRGFPKTTAENIAPSFVHGALLYSSANSQYDSVWCKVLSSKDDDKVRKIFSREIVWHLLYWRRRKNPSKHLIVLWNLNIVTSICRLRKFLTVVFFKNSFGFQCETFRVSDHFFNVNIIFSFFKRIWTLKFLTRRRRVLCIFIPMGI